MTKHAHSTGGSRLRFTIVAAGLVVLGACSSTPATSTSANTAAYEPPPTAPQSSGSSSITAPATTSAPPTTPVPPTTTATSTAPITSTTPALAPASTLPRGACATGQLALTLGPTQGAAGTQYTAVVFTNVSPTSCTITGLPGASLVDAGRNQLGSAAANSPTAGSVPVTVTLAPGAQASARYGASLADITPTCTKATSTSLRIYPPGNTDPLFAPLALEVCVKDPATRSFIGQVVAGADALGG